MAACLLFSCQVRLRRGHASARNPCLRPQVVCLQGRVARQRNCCIQEGQPLPPAERGQPALARCQLQGGRVRTGCSILSQWLPAWCPAVLCRLGLYTLQSLTCPLALPLLQAGRLASAPLLVFTPQEAKGCCLLCLLAHWLLACPTRPAGGALARLRSSKGERGAVCCPPQAGRTAGHPRPAEVVGRSSCQRWSPARNGDA